MKVLFNTYPVAFDCPGGGEIQLLNTQEALEEAGVTIIRFDQWHPQFNEVDVVHHFSVQGGSMNFCGHVHRLGKPLVISPILWLGRDKDNYPLSEIEALLQTSDMVFPNSKAEKEKFIDYFGIHPAKFHVTHNAVENRFIHSHAPAGFMSQFGFSSPFILNVANIETRKNQLNLIRAVKGEQLNLVLVGNIRDQDYFEQCMREGKGFVRYLGYIDHADPILIAAYKECELFILPSLLETPGLAALEAAACGAKVVVTEIGCTKEYFADLATYVDPYSTDSILKSIRTAWQRTNNDHLVEHVAAKFRWQRTAQEVIAGYKLAIDRKIDQDSFAPGALSHC